MIDLGAAPEKWLSKKELVEYLGCSVRSIQTTMTEGLPHVVVYGRCRFRVLEVEEWLEANGKLERRGGGTIDGNGQVARRRVNADGP